MRSMKIQFLGFLITTALIITLCPVKVLAVASDEPSSWAVEQIKMLKTLNLGDPKIYSNYRQDITREEFSMLASSLYENITDKNIDIGKNNPFNDISESAYKTEILKANSLKIISGVGNGKFNPKGKVTRQQVAVMIYNTIKAIHPGVELITNENLIFKDDVKIAKWAKPATTYLYDNYIMGGVSELTAGPLEFTTREQALLFIFKTGILTGFLDEETARKLKDYEISKDDDGKIEDLKTDSAEEYWKLGRKYNLEDKMPERGIAAFNKAIELDPNFYMAYRDKAEAYFFKGMYTESMESAQKAIELCDNDGWCYVHRGKLYSVNKETDKAIEDFTKAMGLLKAEEPYNKDIAGVYMCRARSYLQKVMIKEAISDFKSASGYDPAAGDILKLLGIK